MVVGKWFSEAGGEGTSCFQPPEGQPPRVIRRVYLVVHPCASSEHVHVLAIVGDGRKLISSPAEGTAFQFDSFVNSGNDLVMFGVR